MRFAYDEIIKSLRLWPLAACLVRINLNCCLFTLNVADTKKRGTSRGGRGGDFLLSCKKEFETYPEYRSRKDKTDKRTCVSLTM